jgi:hypothetical protein
MTGKPDDLYNRGMDRQSKPSAGFWCTIAISVAALYAMSFGPACWLSDRHDFVKIEWISTAYRPILAFSPDGKLTGPVGWYAHLGVSDSTLEIEHGRLGWKQPFYDWNIEMPLRYMWPIPSGSDSSADEHSDSDAP